jgi:hypothetical protein
MNMVGPARAIPRTSDRDGYSVRTARFYPFRWNWGACVAMRSATHDETRVWQEIASRLQGQ